MTDYNDLFEGKTEGDIERIQEIIELRMQQAYEELYYGNAESADIILEGLGMAMEEREKWFGVASSTLAPWAAEGASLLPQAKDMIAMGHQALSYSQELILDPDAIFGTRAWAAYEDAVTDSIETSASAESGLLSGNTLASIRDGIGSAAINFRNSEISNAQNQAQLGISGGTNLWNTAFQPSSMLAEAALGVGNQNANAISTAYNQIGINHNNLGVNLANLYTGAGEAQTSVLSDYSSDKANVALSNEAAERQEKQQNIDSALTLADLFLDDDDGGVWDERSYERGRANNTQFAQNNTQSPYSV